MPTAQKENVRIAACAGFSGDRIEPAAYVLEHGNVGYGVFECLAERTIALAQRDKRNGGKGFDPLLRRRMEKVLPICKKKNVKIITNMGAASPVAAAHEVRAIAEQHGITDISITAVVGDDIFGTIGDQSIDHYSNAPLMEDQDPDTPVAKLKDLKNIVSANAYLGAEGIVSALRQGADVVITGRVADPSLFLAPLMFELGWRADDYQMLGKGLVVGHLLECGAQVTGGYFDSCTQWTKVPGIWDVGFPIADVKVDGTAVITKAEGTGGMVTRATCTEQLLYEIHNPAAYITPDAVADFSKVNFTEIGPNRVLVEGATANERTDTLKVSVGYIDCCIGEGEISYVGFNAWDRARLASSIVQGRLEGLPIIGYPKTDIIGTGGGRDPLSSVRLRIAARTETIDAARRVGEEVEALYTNGPAGGGGVRKYAEETISIASILVPRKDVPVDYVHV